MVVTWADFAEGDQKCMVINWRIVIGLHIFTGLQRWDHDIVGMRSRSRRPELAHFALIRRQSRGSILLGARVGTGALKNGRLLLRKM